MTEINNMNQFNNQNTAKRKSLFVDMQYEHGVLTACIVGSRIGEREATVIANAINAKIRDYSTKVSSLVLDFSEVQFVSSLGLGMCIDVRNTAEQYKANTSIIGLTQHLTELFEMMRLDRLFDLETKSNNFDSAA